MATYGQQLQTASDFYLWLECHLVNEDMKGTATAESVCRVRWSYLSTYSTTHLFIHHTEKSIPVSHSAAVFWSLSLFYTHLQSDLGREMSLLKKTKTDFCSTSTPLLRNTQEAPRSTLQLSSVPCHEPTHGAQVNTLSQVCTSLCHSVLCRWMSRLSSIHPRAHLVRVFLTFT